MTRQQVGVDADGWPIFGRLVAGDVVLDHEDFDALMEWPRLTAPPPRMPPAGTTLIIRR